jgi:hypothetical protein
MKACIASFFMNNISHKTVQLQKSVVEKFNKSKYPHYLMQVNMPHGVAIDYFWSLNGNRVNKTFKPEFNIQKQLDCDVILFLDIDAIPLHEDAIDYYIEQAAKGKIIGNAQRSNHIENNQHVFAAPSAIAVSAENFDRMGRPSAYETPRGDVAEEYTYAAEAVGIEVDLVMPLRYDTAPQRYEWEKNQPPYWALADGMPVYGMGTTYGREGKDLFYHNFQIRMEGQQEKFWRKCEDVLVEGIYEDRSIKH